MTTKKILIILNIAGLLGSLIWLMTTPSWESLISSIGLVGTLIALLYNNDRGSKTKMTQKGGENSTNLQSAKDINITIKK